MNSSILRTNEEIIKIDKDTLSDPSSILVTENVSMNQSREERTLSFQVKDTIKNLERMQCKWNTAIMFLLKHSGWEFVSALLVEVYQSMGRKTFREFIDIPRLISEMSCSPILAASLEQYRACGICYTLQIIDASLNSVIAGFISRCQFMAIVKYVLSDNCSFIAIESTPLHIATALVDQILTTAALNKSRFHAEFCSMISLISFDAPWVEDRDSFLVFYGRKKANLKRKRVRWADQEEHVSASPDKRTSINGIVPDDYFSDSLPSDEIPSEELALDHYPIAM